LYNFEVSEQSLSLQFNENHRSKPHKSGQMLKLTVSGGFYFLSKSLHFFDQNLSRPWVLSTFILNMRGKVFITTLKELIFYSSVTGVSDFSFIDSSSDGFSSTFSSTFSLDDSSTLSSSSFSATSATASSIFSSLLTSTTGTAENISLLATVAP